MSEQQLALAPAEPTVELELVDGTIADELADAVVIAAPAAAGLEHDPEVVRDGRFAALLGAAVGGLGARQARRIGAKVL